MNSRACLLRFGLTTSLFVLCMPQNLRANDLDVIPLPMENNLWCWADCAEIIMLKIGNERIRQCRQANDQFGEECCPGAVVKCDRDGLPQFFRYHYDCRRMTRRAITWEEIKDQIDRVKKPFALSYKIKEEGISESDWPGHMIVVYGYLEISGLQQLHMLSPSAKDSLPSVQIEFDYNQDYAMRPDRKPSDVYFDITKVAGQGTELPSDHDLARTDEAPTHPTKPGFPDQANAVRDATPVARAGLKSFRETGGFTLGLKQPEVNQDVELGVPYPLVSVSANRLRFDDSIEHKRSLFNGGISSLIYPIHPKNMKDPIAALTLDYYEGKWHLSTFEDSTRVKKFKIVRDQQSRDQQVEPSDFRVNFILGLNLYFLTRGADEQTMLTPLMNFQGTEWHTDKPTGIKEILPDLIKMSKNAKISQK